VIDPADRLIQDYVKGTDRTMPSDGSGEFGLRPRDVDFVGSPTIYIQMYRVMLASTKVTLQIDDIPDYWHVKVSKTVNSGVFLYPYMDAIAEPILIEAAEMAIIAGRTPYLTIVANATGATVSVIAERGHPKCWIGS